MVTSVFLKLINTNLIKEFLKVKNKSQHQTLKNIKNLTYILFLSFCPLQSFSLELQAEKFVICQQKRATGVYFRTIRIHKIIEGKSSKYFTVYTRQGRDEIIAQGKWLVFCEKIGNQIKNNLEKYLWSCEEQKPVKVFYSDKVF